MEVISEKQKAAIKVWLGSGSVNIFGLPFSGKDTHGTELANFFGGELISGGDILRSQSSPQHLKEHIATGALAPSDEYLSLVLPYISQAKFRGKPLILSTVGRWDGEQESVMKAAESSGHPLKAVVVLGITEQEAVRRWQLAQRDRLDDAEQHVIEKRFHEYREKTLPVIEYYRKLGILIEVDGMPERPEVTEDIFRRLYEFSLRTAG